MPEPEKSAPNNLQELAREAALNKISEWMVGRAIPTSEMYVAIADAVYTVVSTEYETEIERLRAENAHLKELCGRVQLKLGLNAEDHERAILQVIDERDRFHDAADKLAYAVAGEDVIGEHSSANNPWENALNEIGSLRARAEALEAELARLKAESAPVDQQETKLQVVVLEQVLRELYALVKGECPSILSSEDSGGLAHLDLRIASALQWKNLAPAEAELATLRAQPERETDTPGLKQFAREQSHEIGSATFRAESAPVALAKDAVDQFVVFQLRNTIKDHHVPGVVEALEREWRQKRDALILAVRADHQEQAESAPVDQQEIDQQRLPQDGLFAVTHLNTVVTKLVKGEATFEDYAQARERLIATVGRDGKTAYGYLARLFTHYAPQRESSPTLMGLVTQIDNLLVGTRATTPVRDEAIAHAIDAIERWDAGKEPFTREAVASVLRSLKPAAEAELATLRAPLEQKKEDKTFCAELIHQTIPDVAGTEPRPNMER